MNNQSQILSFKVAGLLVPAMAIGAFHLFMSEPVHAGASTADTQFHTLPVIPEWSSDQAGAEPTAFKVSSPFWYEEEELLMPEEPLDVPPEYQAMSEPDPEFVLTTVLPSKNNPLAVINSKPFSPGDEIVKGWTLYKIMGQQRYVILKHESGRRVKVQMTRN